MKRYYKKREYSGSLSGFTTGSVFVAIGIIALVLNTLNVDFIGLRYWGYYLFIPAFFILLGAVGQYFTDKRVRKDVLAAIRSRGNGNYSLDEIAADAGVKRKHLLQVLMDLRADGQIKYMYNSETGEIIIGQEIPYDPIPTNNIPVNQDKQVAVKEPGNYMQYCMYCRHRIEQSNARFCSYCGSEL
ncbi:MAG: hypothetical protein ACTSWN_00645 [Promethearchaeota archaeon]